MSERVRRAFYDFLQAQIATTIFSDRLDKCTITTINGETYKGKVLAWPNAAGEQLKRRAYVKAFKKLKAKCGYWVQDAYSERY